MVWGGEGEEQKCLDMQDKWSQTRDRKKDARTFWKAENDYFLLMFSWESFLHLKKVASCKKGLKKEKKEKGIWPKTHLFSFLFNRQGKKATHLHTPTQ